LEKKISRRNAVKLGVTAVVALAVGAVGGYVARGPPAPVAPASTTTSKGYTIGLMAKDMGGDWWLAYVGAGKWYLESKGHSVIIGNPEYDVNRANTILRTWATTDMDAAIISGMGTGAMLGGIKAMKDAGKLVIITNAEPGYTTDVPFSIMFDSHAGGATAAQTIVNGLEARYGSPEGTVILSICDPGDSDLHQRADGFRSVFQQYGNIEVHEISAPTDRVAGAQTQAATLLKTLSKVDGAGSVEAEGTEGILQALKLAGKLVPIDDPDHVTIAGVDADPVISDALAANTMDLAIDQPVLAYNALGAYYALKILNGEDVKLTPGQVINEQDVDVTYAIPGTDITDAPGPSWAPATVLDVTADYGHLRIGTSSVQLTPTTLSDPKLWSNIAKILDEKGWGF
jgi:ABC-type sugar transport system substrate-binding protein